MCDLPLRAGGSAAVDSDGAVRAVEVQVEAGSEQPDSAQVIQPAGSALDFGHHLHAVGNRCDSIGAIRSECCHLGKDACRVGCPPESGFVEDSHGEDIQATDVSILSPVQRGLDIVEPVVGSDDHQFA